VKLYWLDLETTGLEPDRDVILEVSLSEAEFLDPFNAKHIYCAVAFISNSGIRMLDPVVRDMHTKNGLLAECRASKQSMQSVEGELLKLVPWVEDKAARPILAGSATHFDHRFMAKHWPTLCERFSHRLFDVSALKLFCQSQGMAKFPKGEAHRALADVEESIAHGKLCRDWIMQNSRNFPFQGSH
jgi:oligoribonuclease